MGTVYFMVEQNYFKILQKNVLGSNLLQNGLSEVGTSKPSAIGIKNQTIKTIGCEAIKRQSGSLNINFTK